MASTRWATVVLLVDGHRAASWELTGAGQPTLATVDALARLHLDAARLGWEIALEGACPFLQELLELAGLSAVLAA